MKKDKKVIRCAECSNAAWRQHVGFHGTNELYCMERSGTVEPDDGCTFGCEGKPRWAAIEYEISLGDDAAKHGNW
ncbi:hypothetical protein Ccur_02860 [Cryptobacterium curtum DSM 15641]|uniref:Uncharacterized protein n=1 Tax=Cryptobacterium curtum (strain ATCC 700683 / DSM 15641 / CCUG 43107 / 12-3) TaxID=469378 RepID=C7MM73_CRYCD|nr:hypothetical protein Ccur_02860 [Cryptobacterium curtum DSM 15641]